MVVHDNASVITLSGDIDLTSADALSRLEKQVHGRERIVIDVAGVEHIDTTFLRFLVRLKTHSVREPFAAIELVGVKPRLRRILEITGLARMCSLPAPAPNNARSRAS
jgi:anti-anti-sigma factor